MEQKNETPGRKQLIIAGVPVTLEYRKVKNINLYVRPPEGRVLVTAPPRVSTEHIKSFVESKREWIVRHQDKMRDKPGENERFFSVTRQQIDHMMEMIPKYAQKWQAVMGVRAGRWTVRDMKTRWGSCTVRTGDIRLNSRLAAYPDECLEYVMVHELCHLIEPSHNKRFKNYMTKFLPDWKERKEKLS